MKKNILAIALAIFFIAPLFSVNASAESRTSKYLGEKTMCLEVARIKETRILDNRTILFEMRGGTFYLNRLPVECSGLKLSGGFKYRTSNEKLCSQDSFKVVAPGSAPESTCPLGEFVEFKEKGTVDKVEKLLTGGLLKELVDEGAFKEVFPKK
jgi:hypothetical protein